MFQLCEKHDARKSLMRVPVGSPLKSLEFLFTSGLF